MDVVSTAAALLQLYPPPPVRHGQRRHALMTPIDGRGAAGYTPRRAFLSTLDPDARPITVGPWILVYPHDDDDRSEVPRGKPLAARIPASSGEIATTPDPRHRAVVPELAGLFPGPRAAAVAATAALVGAAFVDELDAYAGAEGITAGEHRRRDSETAAARAYADTAAAMVPALTDGWLPELIAETRVQPAFPIVPTVLWGFAHNGPI